MKKNIIILSALIMSVVIFAGCDKNQEEVGIGDDYIVDINDKLQPSLLFDDSNPELPSLTDEEKMGLIKMREEEKLAYDVYVALYEKWGQNIFDNISESEQTHTDTIRFLIEKYHLEDPVIDPTPGAFTDETIQQLYNSFIEQGNRSLIDALIVGATVEDLDIYDLNQLLQKTNNNDVKIAYQNLVRGSQNHMRAFIRNLEREDGEYSPQYISEDEYQEIILGTQARGSGGQQGSGQGIGGNQGMNRTQ